MSMSLYCSKYNIRWGRISPHFMVPCSMCWQRLEKPPHIASASVQSVLGSALTQELFIGKLLNVPVVESIPVFEVEACSIASCPLLSRLS